MRIPVREPAIKVERPVLRVGDQIKLASDKQRFRVRGVTKRGRFAILTKPFNLQRTVLYTVIDFDRGVRGKDDHYGIGYESDQQIAEALHMFQHTEDEDPPEVTNACRDQGSWCSGGADVSFRSYVGANIATLRSTP